MKPLSSNTLIDISRHSNKTIKLIEYLIRSEQPLIMNALAKIDENSNNIDLIEAFHNDLSKTVNEVADVFQLLSTVDAEDNVIHLDNDEKNLKVLFGEYYDSEWKTVNFSSFDLILDRDFDKEEVTARIIKNTLGLSYREYQKLYKGRNVIYKIQEDSLFTDDDKVEYLSIIKDQDYYRGCIEKIREYADEYSQYRQALTVDERTKIDNEITFSRAMIDSITKQSTYITKEDGVVKLAAKHKKNIHLDRLIDVLNSSRYIKAVELDQKTDLQAIINLIEKTNEINFNLENEVVFKARALGNYNANGLYSNTHKIVAVDIKNPSAGIHEFIHAVDFSKTDIGHSQVRENIAAKFRDKIDASTFTQSQTEYYLSTVEIIARLGELGYVLNKYNYEETESLNDFINRVFEQEAKEHKYDIDLAKPISAYAYDQRNVYFDFTNWNPEEAMQVKEYYQCYFGLENKPIRKIEAAPVIETVSRKTSRAKATRYKVLPVGLFNADNIRYALDYNLENGLLDTKYLLEEVFAHPAHLDRTSKAYKMDSANRQNAVFREISEWIKEKDDPFLYAIATEFVAKVYCWNQNAAQLMGLSSRKINYDSRITYEQYKPALRKAFASADEKMQQMNELSEKLANDELSQEERKAILDERDGINQARWINASETRVLKTEYFGEKNKIIKDLIPEIDLYKKEIDDIWTANWRDDGKIQSRIKSSALGKIVAPLKECVNYGLEAHGIEKISSYWGADSITPFLLATKGALTVPMGKEFENQKPRMITGLLANGFMSSLLANRGSELVNLSLPPSYNSEDDIIIETYRPVDFFENLNLSIRINEKTLESEIYSEYGDPDIDSFWIRERNRIKDTYSEAPQKTRVIKQAEKEKKQAINSFIEEKVKKNEVSKPKNDNGQLGFDF